jgi:ribonuclease T
MSDHRIKKRFDGLLPIVVDLETGGVNYQTDALLELAAISLAFNADNKLGCKATYSCHIEPFEGAHIDPKALEINHIDPYHPFRFAISEESALVQLFDFINKELEASDCKRAVLVGHNAHFDLYFLHAAVKRCQLKNPFHSFTVFDTATLGGIIYGKTVLARAIKAAKIPYDREKAHSAIYDTEITAALFCDIINQLPPL